MMLGDGSEIPARGPVKRQFEVMRHPLSTIFDPALELINLHVLSYNTMLWDVFRNTLIHQ